MGTLKLLSPPPISGLGGGESIQSRPGERVHEPSTMARTKKNPKKRLLHISNLLLVCVFFQAKINLEMSKNISQTIFPNVHKNEDRTREQKPSKKILLFTSISIVAKKSYCEMKKHKLFKISKKIFPLFKRKIQRKNCCRKVYNTKSLPKKFQELK